MPVVDAYSWPIWSCTNRGSQAGFEQVGGVGASEEVEVESAREAELFAVPSHSSDQGRLNDKASAPAWEQVERARVTAAVGEPVFEDARRPSPNGEHAAAL